MTSTLESFFKPKSVAVIGVSSKPHKLGSVIFQNILDSKFEGTLFGINPKMEGDKLLDCDCFAEIQNTPDSVDLAIIVIPGKYVLDAIEDCVKNGTKNVIIISAGFSEVGNTDLEDQVLSLCDKNNINLLGPNCLGTIFPYAHLNASFADGYPQKGGICFVSQSGAFCTAMLDWAAEKNIGFSHFVSLGNKAGISEIEILKALQDDDDVEIFAFYLESLKDGKKFLEVLKKVTLKKPVVILEPGKSAKAAEAASSHTGSLAPNYRVLENAYREVGAIQVSSMRMMFGCLEVLNNQANKNVGKNLAVVTNAGGVGVLTTDLTEEYELNLAEFSEKTKQQLSEHLPAEANTKNPVDIIGDAKADRYESALEIVLKDENVDQVLVLLTPQRTTEIEETAKLLNQYAGKTDKLITASFIGGAAVSRGIPLLEVPHFEFPVDATRTLGKLANYQVWKENNKNKKSEALSVNADKKFKTVIDEAQKAGLPSLAQSDVDDILSHFGFDFPGSENFSDFEKALDFADRYFPGSVVMKISSPEALHKTDMKGVVLNVSDAKLFKNAWDVLQNSIKSGQIPNASIQVQEQIGKGTEVILGINADENFGHVMLFGSGGIYTEVFKDTSVRVLPTHDFERFIDETKVSEILHGTRGENPKAVKKLIETMQKMQELVLTYPEITSIDANPVIVTEDRAVCVDFKILI